MKHLKTIFLCLMALVLCFSTVAVAAELPEPDPVLLYVTDLAEVLSPNTEEKIAAQNDALYAATGAQFAILTVDSLPAGYDSESYCYEVFNAWGVGSAEKNNGLLLLLVPDEGKFWMTSGTGLQNHFSGGMISELLDEYLATDFDAGRYDEGVLALFDAVWAELETLYGEIDRNSIGTGSTAPEQEYMQPEYDYTEVVDDHYRTSSRFAVFFVILIVVIILCIALRPGRRYRTRHTPPPPAPGHPPYYRTYAPRPRRTIWHAGPPAHHHAPPPPPPRGGQPGRPSGGFSSSRPSTRSPGSGSSSRSFGGGSSSRSFGGGSSVSRSSGGSRSSFGGGRSHGGGGGRR